MGTNKRAVLTILAVAVLTAGCADPPTTPEDIEQEFLFEVEMVNSAFIFNWVGIVIDRQGRIVRFDHSHEPWVPVSAESVTESELREKYEHEQTDVGSVDIAQLVEQFAFIPSVRDEFSSPNRACADAGVLRYSAFRFDPATDSYEPLTLRVEGDLPRQNTSRGGLELSGWLRRLLLDNDIPGVRPFLGDFCVP